MQRSQPQPYQRALRSVGINRESYAGRLANTGRLIIKNPACHAGCPILESLSDSRVGDHEPPFALPAGCPILESLSDSRVGEATNLRSPFLPGAPSLNRFLIQGWEATNLRSPFLLLHDPEPMCEPLDINFFCNAKGSSSIPEVRRLSLSHLQLLSKAAVAGRGRSLHGLRARA